MFTKRLKGTMPLGISEQETDNFSIARLICLAKGIFVWLYLRNFLRQV